MHFVNLWRTFVSLGRGVALISWSVLQMREAVVSLKPAVFSNLNAKLKKLGHDAIDTSAYTTGVATKT
jgi:hypothetical protein